MNYYNEWDSKAADGLRELIKQGLIPDGVVDNRSITDVTANDLMGFKQCHFFAGVAGWSYALQLAGWSEDRQVWTGSCPCQPFSTAGKRGWVNDDRHLWPVFFNLIKECRPAQVFGEQVASSEIVGTKLETSFTVAVQAGDYARANKIANKLVKSPALHYWKRWVDGVHADLAAIGYSVRWEVLGAHSVGAPHQRQRLYWGGSANLIPDSNSDRCKRQSIPDERRADMLEASRGGIANLIPDTADNGRDECNQGAGGTFGISEQGRLLESEGTCNCNRMAYSISNAQGSSQGTGAQERTDGQLDNRNGIWNDDRNSNAACSIPVADAGLFGQTERQEQAIRGVKRGEAGGVANSESAGTGQHLCGIRKGLERHNGNDNFSGVPWSRYALVYCRDNKVRRVPAESVLFGVADGVSEGMDECSVIGLQAAGGFPLCQPQEFAKGEIATLLKQYGNAIVPQVAAEFIRAFNKKRN